MLSNFYVVPGVLTKEECEQIILNVSLDDTQKKLDKALKRNLEKQSPKNLEKLPTTTSEDVTEEATK